jgi:HEAT repeat protein
MIAELMANRMATRQARATAALCLGMIGESAEPFLPDLLATLTDPDDLVSIEASKSVVSMKYSLKEAHLDAIAALLGHKEPVVRIRGVQILGTLDERAKHYVPEIIKVTADKDPRVVMNVIAVLTQFGQSMEHLDAVEMALKPLADHNDKDVQFAATQGLGVLAKFRQAFTKP